MRGLSQPNEDDWRPVVKVGFRDIGKNTVIIVEVAGDDEKEALEVLGNLIKDGFGE